MRLSIIIAVWRSTKGLEALLEEILSQQPDQILVVSDVLDSLPGNLQLLRYPVAPTISHLWAAGLREANGEVVVFTTSHFRPEPTWVRSIRHLHLHSDSVGIGGPILSPPSLEPRAWAIYFQRYHRWLNWSFSGPVSDIPGDNSSYKRERLLSVHDLDNAAFWEHETNAILIRQGEILEMSPQLAVRQVTPFSFKTFLIQRYVHGREFGERRMEGAPEFRKYLFISAFPAISVVLLAKILRTVACKPRLWIAFVLSFPFLFLSLLAWSAGETHGYLLSLGQES